MNRPNNQTADSAAHDVRTCEKPICRAERNRLRALRGAEGDVLTAKQHEIAAWTDSAEHASHTELAEGFISSEHVALVDAAMRTEGEQ